MKQNCMFKELQSGQHSSMVAVYYSGCVVLESLFHFPWPLFLNSQYRDNNNVYFMLTGDNTHQVFSTGSGT